MKKRRKQYSAGAIIWIIFKYVSLVFFSFVAVIPIISCVITAFKTEEEYKTTNVMTLPQNWFNFDNFVEAFQRANMGRAFVNSVMFLFAALLPGVAMQVTVYQIMHDLGFINHLYGYIIMMMGTDVISIYIFIQYMENIPVSLDESAIIDGASYWKIYWKIMLPLLKPAIVTACILKGVGVYNEYYSANLYLTKENLKTMAISLYTFTGPLGSQYNLICAGVIISLLPALIVFIVFQKQIYSGITAGAVKG